MAVKTFACASASEGWSISGKQDNATGVWTSITVTNNSGRTVTGFATFKGSLLSASIPSGTAHTFTLTGSTLESDLANFGVS